MFSGAVMRTCALLPCMRRVPLSPILPGVVFRVHFVRMGEGDVRAFTNDYKSGKCTLLCVLSFYFLLEPVKREGGRFLIDEFLDTVPASYSSRLLSDACKVILDMNFYTHVGRGHERIVHQVTREHLSQLFSRGAFQLVL